MESLTLQEQLTLSFYEFDYLNKGYYLADSVIDIEPPYIPPFSKLSKQNTADDGIEPSFIKLIGNLFKVADEEEIKEDEGVKIIPITTEPELVGFSCSFPNGQDISAPITLEFINQLSFTETPISFEIIGTYETITFQIVCDKEDLSVITSQINAFFPTIMMRDISAYDIGFDLKRLVGIVDFGIDNESLIPLATTDNYNFDPLTPFIATLDNLHLGDTAMLQIMFKGVSAPFSYGMQVASNDGSDGSFFEDFKELPKLCTEKTSYPLFATIIRVVAQGSNQQRTNTLGRELIRNISNMSQSAYNNLIPLSNKGYEYEDGHLKNVYYRQSNRLGMILSSKELATFFHFPNKTLVSRKLNAYTKASKLALTECLGQSLPIGLNIHNGIEKEVSLSSEQLLRHCHILGSTGVGKSTLIANMVIAHMEQGNGCTIFDPHGDIIDDILLRVPKHRINDVVLIDPSDTDFPIGFNLLHAKTEAEKIVLSSDLVSAFKRHATAWGDTMSSVLSNAINCFLESEQGGTIIELKRFLIEDSFRSLFLDTVDDNSIHYYWSNEYPLVKKRIAPLLTRIDTFLRPKIIRFMLAQKDGIDFRECIEQKKIVLIKLSQGLIGESNSFLLGSMFLSKINQSALARQDLAKDKRHPYYVFCDEFHNIITPSINSLLSGARKYGISLTLAHQELAQIEDTKVLHSVISNPHIRICFRLGDFDAKKLESGFASFEQTDLQALDVGETIMRVGGSNSDFNLNTFHLVKQNENAENIRNKIIEYSRKNYAKPKAEIQILIDSLLPKGKIKNVVKKVEYIQEEIITQTEPIQNINIPQKEKIDDNLKSLTETYEKHEVVQDEVRKHRVIQNSIRTIAQQHGFKSVLEAKTDDGGRIDVSIERDSLKIAFEVSITNSIDYEVKNIKKCINAEYKHIILVSPSKIHLKNIKIQAKRDIDSQYHKRLKFILPDDITKVIDSFKEKKKPHVKRLRGYRVTSNHVDIDYSAQSEKSNSLKNVIRQTLKGKK